MAKKMISFRIDTELLDKINKLGESKTDVIQKALELYIQSKQNVNTKRNTIVNTKVNHVQQEKLGKEVNREVDHKVQIIENYELLEYLKRDHEWLKDRVVHFENIQDKIIEKLDVKVKKEKEISWFRM